ncbi:DUF6557 family protein [Macellibacteroides fermentans]|uniref:DUF6557 family protein n=1 Tax=Macellibacteroides fermentans TaxID=879969 RepID=UPI00406CF6BB
MSESGDFMIFRDLIKSVVFDDVWEELNKVYSMKDGGFEAYQRVFNQLKELMPELNDDGFRLIVARVEDKFEPGTFIFEVFGIKPGDKDHYALELSPWEEWLSFEVIEKCIEVYDAAAVVAHFIYGLTFFGYDVSDVQANIKREIEILGERQEEIENGTAKLISLDAVRKNYGFIDNRTEEEKELQHKQFEWIIAENKRVYEELLS